MAVWLSGSIIELVYLMYLRINDTHADYVQKRCGHCRSIEVSRSRLRLGESMIVALSGYRPYRCLDCYCRSWSKNQNIQTQVASGLALLAFIVMACLLVVADSDNALTRSVTHNATETTSHQPLVLDNGFVQGKEKQVILHTNLAMNLLPSVTEELPLSVPISNIIEPQTDLISEGQSSINGEQKVSPRQVESGDVEAADIDPIEYLTIDSEEGRELIANEVERWRDAWDKGDLVAYLSMYSNGFVPARRETSSAWRERRVKSLSKLGEREITISELDVLWSDDRNLVNLNFIQTYASTSYSDEVRKRLVMKKEGESYKIVEEKTLTIL